MIEELRRHINQGRISVNEISILRRHFTTPDGEPIDYTFQGMVESLNNSKLSNKELDDFWSTVDKANSLQIIEVYGLIKKQEKSEIEKIIHPAKPAYALKPGWANAIKQYLDEQK
ncbi:MAG TPA: hypothetical protein VI875_05000 [Candidatus Norongarragalinales archaeon]|nr:hypothetical protein [Candidatus Norongarragalinales archaeon]